MERTVLVTSIKLEFTSSQNYLKSQQALFYLETTSKPFPQLLSLPPSLVIHWLSILEATLVVEFVAYLQDVEHKFPLPLPSCVTP